MQDLRDKSLEALRYILRDASEAAQAMRGHDPVAEGKYMDQLGAAHQELVRRGAAL